MRKFINFLFSLTFIFILSGCALHDGYINNSAALGDNNFSYIHKDMRGTASTVKVFGIGGLGDSGLVEMARLDMLGDVELQSNQALVNVSVSWKNSWVFFVRKDQCIVTADIVEFN